MHIGITDDNKQIAETKQSFYWPLLSTSYYSLKLAVRNASLNNHMQNNNFLEKGFSKHQSK